MRSYFVWTCSQIQNSGQIIGFPTNPYLAEDDRLKHVHSRYCFPEPSSPFAEAGGFTFFCSIADNE